VFLGRCQTVPMTPDTLPWQTRAVRAVSSARSRVPGRRAPLCLEKREPPIVKGMSPSNVSTFYGAQRCPLLGQEVRSELSETSPRTMITIH
jgi:hypothetical protein